MNGNGGVMRRGMVAVSAALAFVLVLVGLPSVHAVAAEDRPLRVIVELEGTPALAATLPAGLGAGRPDPLVRQRVKAASEALRVGQRAVVDRARRTGVHVADEHGYSLLLDAVVMEIPAGDVDRLAAIPGVAAVSPDRPVRASTEASVPLVGAPELWQSLDGQGRPVRGQGVTVAVIDTGIDYTHPDLGGGFGEGHKVVGGYDFVNHDADPMDDNSHGTHVAGIIAGDGGVTGVAPAASLTAYKALDAAGGGSESDIIAALEAAVDPANPHRADVINMSLGGDGDGTEPLGRAATAASRGGTVVVAAAGNGGPGAQTVGTPAAADGVIAVGASASGLRLPAAYLASPRRELLQTYRSPISANPPAQPVTADLVDVGGGQPEDYDRAGDVHGKVVVAHLLTPGSPEQVSVWFIEQARHAEERSALALLGYEYIGGDRIEVCAPGTAASSVGPGAGEVAALPHALASGDSLRMDRLVVLGMYGDQYDQLACLLRDGPVRVTIEGTDVTDHIATFSSRGPTGRFTLKPDLVAPGIEIRSTIPKELYAPGELRFSGTSMAAPHVAGAAALLRQLHPDHGQDRVAAALIGGARPLGHAGPTTQGAGRLDIRAAADATVTASPPSLSLGLADLSRPTIGASGTVQLRNGGVEPVTVALAAMRAPDSAGTATVEPARATIPAGGTVDVSVRVSADRPVADTDLAGWVTVDLENGGQDVRVPYLLAARLLVVQPSPDPSDGTSTVFVYSPAPLAQPPTVAVTSPQGQVTEVTTRLDHGSWYRAEVSGNATGVYQLQARAWTVAGQRLIGAGGFEVVPVEHRGKGGRRWQPVGPNSTAGTLTTSPAAPRQGVLTLWGQAGVWRTDDRGALWSQQNRLPVAGGNGKVLIDPRDGRRMWYAVNGNSGGFFASVFDPTYQGKILRTRDGGDTWVTLDFPDVHVYAFVMGGGQVLVAVTGDSVLVSSDGGDTWAAHPGGWGGEEPSAAAVSGDDLYVSTFGGVWAVRGVTGAAPAAPERVYVPSPSWIVDLAADGELVAVARGDGTVIGSRDAGRTFGQLFKPPGFGAVALRMVGDDLFLSAFGEDYVGRDHGRDWATVPKPLPGPVDIDFDRWPGDQDTLLVSAGNGGLFGTKDQGGSYRRIGVQGMTVHDLAVASDKDGRPVLLAGTDSAVYRTLLPTGQVTASTAEWGLSGREGFFGTTVKHLAVSPEHPEVVWRILKTALNDFFVDRSQDGGATWTTVRSTFEVPDALLVHPADPNRVVVAFRSLNGDGLFVTKDGGVTWKKLYHPVDFSAVAGDPTDPDLLWLGSPAGLFRSDDGGITVTKVLGEPVAAVWVDPGGSRRLVVGGERIYLSADGGGSFRTADTGALPLRVSSLAASPADPGTLYAGTTSHTANGLLKGGRGVLRSSDGGDSWVNVSAGLQNTAVTSLAFSPDGRWLYAGTVGGGTHRLQIGGG